MYWPCRPVRLKRLRRSGHRPPLIAVARCLTRRAALGRLAHPLARDDLTAVRLPAVQHHQADAGEVAQRGVEARAAELATHARRAVHDEEAVGLGAQRLPEALRRVGGDVLPPLTRSSSQPSTAVSSVLYCQTSPGGCLRLIVRAASAKRTTFLHQREFVIARGDAGIAEVVALLDSRRRSASA